MSPDHLSTSLSPPPPPPPLPPSRMSESRQAFALKVRAAPPGWAFEGKVTKKYWDGLSPPTGTYFFYGTLQDPQLLREILDIPNTPDLQPAYMIGYALRLWGQYPALVDSPGTVVEGMAFGVEGEALAEKLAYYETNNYRPVPCNIRSRESEEVRGGYAFKFCGDLDDLTDGEFDLDVWLKRMGRNPESSRRDAGA